MVRFIAITWNRERHQRPSRLLATLYRKAGGWTCVRDHGGLAAFIHSRSALSASVYVLPDNCGVLIGALFHRSDDPEAIPADVATKELNATVLRRTDGASLIDDYWGAYVAILRDENSYRTVLLRDPAGRLPCYRWRGDDCDLFCSDFEDVADLALSLSINWTFLAEFIYNDRIRSANCAYREVSEILPGERLIVTPAREFRDYVWDPRSIARGNVIERADEAARTLCAITRSCLNKWSAHYGRFLHSLSGGFDSAVVLGCASRSPARPGITALNRFIDRAGEDERHFARRAAELAGCELIERPWTFAESELEPVLGRLPRLAKPSSRLIGRTDLELRAELATSLDVSVLWTGVGGDQLFLQSKTNLIAADYLAFHGFNGSFLRTVDQVARLARQSFWHVLAAAIGVQLARGPARPNRRSASQLIPFLNPAAVDASVTEAARHPWSIDRGDVAKGKLLQIAALADLVGRTDPFRRLEALDEHNVLVSQPILEVCMRIPTYVLMHGGRARGLARHAFSDYVPHEILARETKGATTSGLRSLLLHNVAFLRPYLLDGLLSQQKLIDRPAVEQCLVPDRPIRIGRLMPLYSCIAAEAWLRSALTKRQRAAA